MYTLHRFDPYLKMDDSYPVCLHDDMDSVWAHANEHHKWWAEMVGEELPAGTVVTLNVDSIADPSIIFINIIVPDEYAAAENYPKYQSDMLFIIRDDPDGPESDVSEIGGAQCTYCGRANVTNEYNERYDLVAPVWRQSIVHPENLLCDECSDREWGKAECNRACPITQYTTLSDKKHYLNCSVWRWALGK